MKRLRRALFIAALALFPLASLLGGLLYLLWWVLPVGEQEEVLATIGPAKTSTTRLMWSLALGFCLLSGLTGICSAIPLWQLAGWLSRYLLPGLLIWGTYRALRNGRLRAVELVTGLLAGSLLLASIGLGNYFLHWQSHPQLLCSPAYGRFCLLDLLLLAEDRARGFSMHPNVLGILLANSLPLWLWGLAQGEKKLRAGLALGLIATLVCLLVSYSRAAWLAGIVSLGLGGGWLFGGRRSRLWLAAPAGVALLLMVGYWQRLAQRLGSLLAAQGSQQSRLQLWQGGVRMLRDHLGLGTGLLQVEPLFALYLPPIAGGAGHLHNWYLQVAVESGLPAALLLFGLLALLLGDPRRLGPLGRGAWLAWLSFGLASLFDVTLLDLRVSFEMSLLLGLVLAEAETQTG